MTKLTTLSAIALLFAACTGTPDVTPPDPKPDVVEPVVDALPAKVTKAVELARSLRANPDKAADTLAAAGMTKADLDALMYEIASDPKLSAAYTSALGE